MHSQYFVHSAWLSNSDAQIYFLCDFTEEFIQPHLLLKGSCPARGWAI